MELRQPDDRMLADYVVALGRGWSPNSGRDTSAIELAEIRADPDVYLHHQRTSTGTIVLADGSLAERLPGLIRWIWDDGFCGNINFRHLPDTEDLPEHVSGHVGYNVVPWRRGKGIATRALGLFLPMIQALGVARVKLTCDDGNPVSARVIEANGGIEAPGEQHEGTAKRVFWIDL